MKPTELAARWADWNRRHDMNVTPSDFERAHSANSARLLDPEHPDFPALGALAPDFLYVRGDTELLRRPARIAVVGSRHSGVEGQRLARWVADSVVMAGGIVCSGGAIGTDTIAHESATHRDRPTICVMPSGIDVATPRRNRRLFEVIANNGCLVSAYPMGVTARPYHYHARNALLVALSDAVVVVRAREKSGSRITGEAALTQGKPLFVVPGSPDDPHARGCLDLIEKGARIYRSIDDLSLSRTDHFHEAVTAPGLVSLSEHGRLIVAALQGAGGAGTADEIADAVGLSPAVVASELVELELWGVCQRPPGGSVVTLASHVTDSSNDDAMR